MTADRICMSKQAIDDDFFEEIEVVDEIKPKVIEVYRSSLGKQVSLDFFLFTCFEEEVTFKSFNEETQRHLNQKRWPTITPLLRDLRYSNEAEKEEILQPLKEQSIRDAVAELFSWYAQAHPALAAGKTLDYEVHSEIVREFVLLTLDFGLLVESLTGKRLESHDKLDQAEESKEIWEALKENLEKHFPAYQQLMWSYFEWNYKKTPPPSYDLASLPPVGRYAFLLQKAAREKGRDKSSNRNRQNSQNNGYDRNRNEKQTFNKKEGSSPRRENSKRGESTSSKEKEEEAMADALQACKIMKTNGNKKELQLKPQNSYLRRLQHKLVGDEGLKSSSVGEGADRAVKISID